MVFPEGLLEISLFHEVFGLFLTDDGLKILEFIDLGLPLVPEEGELFDVGLENVVFGEG